MSNNLLQEKLNLLTKNIYGQLFVALLLGGIQVFSFSPFDQWWVVYPSFIGFFFLLQQVQATTQRYLWVSFAFSLSMLLATIHWVYVSMDLFGGMPKPVSVFLIVLLCAYLAIYPTIALWASTKFLSVSRTLRYLLLIPVFWLISDWLRGFVLTGFPWGYLGYSHIDTPLIGFAPVLGVQGVTLAIMVTAGALTLLIQKQKVIVNLAVISLLFTSGYFLQKIQYTERQPEIMVSLVQGNIDQNEKWKKDQLYPSLFKYLDLSETGLDDQPELIIWPESAIAALEIEMQAFLQPLSNELAAKNKTLITGIIDYNLASKEYFNSIIMLGDTKINNGYAMQNSNRYQKHQLLPIGEFVPFEDILRPLAPYFNLPMSSFQRGDEVQTNLVTKQTSFASALCYEIAFPELLRKNISEKTGVLLTVSNDAWFGDSIGPDQHLQIARMRAIEFSRPVLRGTNNGITAIIDADGTELGRLERNVAAVLSHKVQPTFGETPYQRFGSYPLHIYSFLILLYFMVSTKKFTRKNKQKIITEV